MRFAFSIGDCYGNSSLSLPYSLSNLLISSSLLSLTSITFLVNSLLSLMLKQQDIKKICSYDSLKDIDYIKSLISMGSIIYKINSLEIINYFQ